MNATLVRGRLLAGAAVALGTMVAAQPARAACTFSGYLSAIKTCTSTTTTDTTGTGPTDRNENYYTELVPISVIVSAGETVDGYGLSAVDGFTGTYSFTFQNDGSVIVFNFATPTAGGNDAAVNIASVNSPVIYTGAGSISNVGVGEGLAVAISGTGSLNAAVGGNVASNSSDAIQVSSTAANGGAITITTAAGKVLRSRTGDGIDVSTAGTGDVNIVNNAQIASEAIANTLQNGIIATSTGTGGISVANGTDRIGLTVDRAQLTGITASIQNAASAGNVQVTQGTGSINSVGTGIVASTTGSGMVTVTSGGGINSTGGGGINASSTSGNINIDSGVIQSAQTGILTNSAFGSQVINVTGNVAASGSGAEGVNAFATTGSITVNVTGGNVTAGSGFGANGIQVSALDNMAINIAAGRSVTAGPTGWAIYGNGPTGTMTIDNAGTIGAVGGVAIVGDLFTTTHLTNQANGVINGVISLAGAQNNIFTNSGIWNGAGINYFGYDTDLVTNQAGGVINLSAGSIIDALETLNNAGTINIANGLTFDNFDTAVTNTGTVYVAGTLDFLAGPDSLANSSAGVINLTGATTLAGLESFTQSGLIKLNAYTLTGTGTLANTGTLSANGSAALAGFTALSNSGTIDLQDGAANDMLTVNGTYVGSGASALLLDVGDTVADQLVISGAASGSTAIGANLIGTGLLNSNGVLLVDAGSSSAGAFTLGGVGGNASPLLDYGLEQRGADYYLVTSLNATGFTPLPVTLLAGEMWHQSADAVIDQARLPSDGTGRLALWGQVYAGKDKAGGHDSMTVAGTDYDVDNRLDTDRFGLQAGAGYPLGGMGVVGVTGGYERAEASGDMADYVARGWNIGLYGLFGGARGLHGSLLVKHDAFHLDLGQGVFDGIDPDGRSNGIDGEVGYRLGGTAGMGIDVSAGLNHVSTRIDGFDLAGFSYDYDHVTSTRGRVGVRATGNGPMSPFVDARLFHEFSGDGDVALSDGLNSYQLSAQGRGTWGRIEAGIGGPGSGIAPMVAAWVDLGDVKGFGARAGFRF